MWVQFSKLSEKLHFEKKIQSRLSWSKTVPSSRIAPIKCSEKVLHRHSKAPRQAVHLSTCLLLLWFKKDTDVSTCADVVSLLAVRHHRNQKVQKVTQQMGKAIL
jgi:hypothetical protein